jgi:hydroxymethylglutaryl-CoA reductase (NADPH)
VSSTHCRARDYIANLLQGRSLDALLDRLAPRGEPPPPRLPSTARLDLESLDRRWAALPPNPAGKARLLDPHTLSQLNAYAHNIENLIGTLKVPVGVAGPLRVNGLFAQGDFFVPLATTEAALVASYSRGAQAITEAGGCTAMLLAEGIGRAPGFVFRDVREVGRFLVWALAHVEDFRREAEATTRHGKLVDMRIAIEGNHVYLSFEFTTGDAAGQNMVTIATEAICAYIGAESPVQPRASFVEANLSGDKKASAQSFLSVRGKKVTVEATLPRPLVGRRLHTTPDRMVEYWRMSAIGGVLSGTLGIHGHYANGLAALYLATGQDVACVAESAVGVTRLEMTPAGDLYAAVTLPNLTVGTVGGGTGLPSQRACLEILGLAGPGHAQALAEVCAGLCLAGEVSIIGALAAGEFTRAHERLTRGRRHAERGEVASA